MYSQIARGSKKSQVVVNLNICVVGSSKRFFSGLAAHTIFLANALAKRGHEVSVVTLRNLVPLFLYPGRKRVGKGEYLVDFAPEVKVYDGMDWNSPRTWLGALRFINKQKPDAVIVLWWTSSVAHLQLILALGTRLNGRPRLILEMHEVVDPLEEKILPIRLYSRAAGRILIRKFDLYTTHSKKVSEAVVNTYHISKEKVHVVPFGVYEQYATLERNEARKELNLDGFVILHFGMIRQYKGIPLLIKAFDLLPEEVAEYSTLVIGGEDWGDDPGLKPAIEGSRYRHRIIFRPSFIPDHEVPKYFAAADVVVLPYLRTCGSAVAHIAVANGRPVITTDLPAMRECLNAYEGASFFPPGDVATLRDRLIEVYHRWVKESPKNYSFHGPSWDEIAGQYEEIISGLNVREK